MTFKICVTRGFHELRIGHLCPDGFTDEMLREKIASMRLLLKDLDPSKADSVRIEMDDYDARIKHVSLEAWNPELETLNMSPLEIVRSLVRSVEKAVKQ